MDKVLIPVVESCFRHVAGNSIADERVNWHDLISLGWYTLYFGVWAETWLWSRLSLMMTISLFNRAWSSLTWPSTIIRIPWVKSLLYDAWWERHLWIEAHFLTLVRLWLFHWIYQCDFTRIIHIYQKSAATSTFIFGALRTLRIRHAVWGFRVMATSSFSLVVAQIILHGHGSLTFCCMLIILLSLRLNHSKECLLFLTLSQKIWRLFANNVKTRCMAQILLINIAWKRTFSDSLSA